MPSRFIERSSRAAAMATGSHAGIGVDSDDNALYYKPDNSTDRVRVEAGKRAQGTLTVASALTAADSGKILFLNASTEFATTLPAPAAGLHFEFIVDAAPSGASYTIASASGTDNIHGVVISAEDAAGSGDSTAGTAADLITIVDGKAKVGDRVVLDASATKWFAIAYVTEQDAVTYTAT